MILLCYDRRVVATPCKLFSCGLVLDHVPVLDQNSVLDAHNSRHNPVHRAGRNPRIARARQSPLFTQEELAVCTKRLKDCGYLCTHP
jgi:hypothetical protein